MTVVDDDHFWTEGSTGQSGHQICSIVTNYDSFPFSKILTSGLQTQGIKKPGEKVLGQNRDLASNDVFLLASCVTMNKSLHLCILVPAAMQLLCFGIYTKQKKFCSPNQWKNSEQLQWLKESDFCSRYLNSCWSFLTRNCQVYSINICKTTTI